MADPGEPLAAVREGYDRWAAVYDHDANPLPALEETHVRAAVGDVRGLAVVDLGCGTGRHATWLAAAGADVTAVDFSEGMLEEARRRADGAAIRFLAHDLHEPLPFPAATFDLAVSGLVLEHLRDLPAFFAEAHRVLRPGGRAVVSAMHPAMFLRGSQARFTDPDSGAVVQPGSLPHGIGDFVMAAVRAGFRLDGVDEYAPDAALAARYPRAEKYVGWPMLVVLTMQAGLPARVDSRSVGDERRHLTCERLEVAFAALPDAPRDAGRVALIVSKGAGGERATPRRAVLTVDGGVPGDAWGRHAAPNPLAQLAVMQLDVAELIANGQPLTLFGDNLFLDLDLSAANLPIGSRVRAGSVVLEVTPKPHNGCRKFRARFGDGALRFVADPERRPRNLRGIYLRVVEGGELATGDAIEVISRPAP